MPYTMSWVASVTMNGCRLNLAVQKPLTAPTSAPMAMTAKMTMGTGTVPMPGNILLGYSAICSSEAATQAVRPTTRPAERSVPVRMIAPAMPSAMGRFAAESETMLMMDFIDTKFGL